MHRRHVLRGVGATVGLSLIGTGCGSDGPPEPGAAETLSVQAASIEFLVGANRWIAFGLEQVDRSPVEDAEVEVYLRRIATSSDQESEVIAGPLTPEYSPAADTGRGVYFLQGTFDEPGLYDIVAVLGGDHGTAAIQVVDPVDSRVPVPGSEAIGAPTPTPEEDLGVFSICTQDPPCGMHEVSLDEALDSGQPVVLMFATPEFCQTAVCGPSVQTLDSLRTGGDWGDTIFIHSEIFAEAPVGADAPNAPLTPAVEAWSLPSEPWMFTIGADGVILNRLDGPMPQPILESLVTEVAT